MAIFWQFLAKIGQKWIFFKNPLGTFFYTPKALPNCKVSEKSNVRIPRYPVTNGRTNERTDNSESLGLNRLCRKTKNLCQTKSVAQHITKKFNQKLEKKRLGIQFPVLHCALWQSERIKRCGVFLRTMWSRLRKFCLGHFLSIWKILHIVHQAKKTNL